MEQGSYYTCYPKRGILSAIKVGYVERTTGIKEVSQDQEENPTKYQTIIFQWPPNTKQIKPHYKLSNRNTLKFTHAYNRLQNVKR